MHLLLPIHLLLTISIRVLKERCLTGPRGRKDSVRIVPVVRLTSDSKFGNRLYFQLADGFVWSQHGRAGQAAPPGLGLSQVRPRRASPAFTLRDQVDIASKGFVPAHRVANAEGRRSRGGLEYARPASNCPALNTQHMFQPTYRCNRPSAVMANNPDCA